MALSEKAIRELQDIYKKDYDTELTYEEAVDAGNRLLGITEILYKQWRIDLQRKAKLKEFPKGFAIEGRGYTCRICHNSTHGDYENWYDRWGIKCQTCQDAINRKEISPSLVSDDKKWYTKYDLESTFNLSSSIIRSWVKKGILKERTLTHYGNGIHFRFFLIKDNQDFLPPKELVKSQFVSEVKEDGKTWYHSEPWYKFCDPHKHLKGYKIMDYLKVTIKED